MIDLISLLAILHETEIFEFKYAFDIAIYRKNKKGEIDFLQIDKPLIIRYNTINLERDSNFNSVQ